MFARKPLAMLSIDTSSYCILGGYQPYFNQVKHNRKTDQPKGHVVSFNPVIPKFNEEVETLHPLEVSYDFRASESVLKYFDSINHHSASGKIEKITLVALLKYLTITHKEFHQKPVLADDKPLHNEDVQNRIRKLTHSSIVIPQNKKAVSNIVQFPKLATMLSGNLALDAAKSHLLNPSLAFNNYTVVDPPPKTLDCTKVSLGTLKDALFKHRNRSAYIDNLYEYLYANAKPLPLSPKLRAIIWQVQGGTLPDRDYFLKTGLLKQLLDVVASDLAIKHFNRLSKILDKKDVEAGSNKAKVVLMEARRLANLNIPCCS